jgi:protein-tyrosine-phosphatase
MAEVGIDISANSPKVLTVDAVQASDVVITMGCGDACPIFPGKRIWTGISTTPPARVWTTCGPSATRSAAGCSSLSPSSRRSSPSERKRRMSEVVVAQEVRWVGTGSR